MFDKYFFLQSKMAAYCVLCVILVLHLIHFPILTSNSMEICPEVLLQYNDKCFAECPTGTKVIAGRNNCTDHCPSFAPIQFDKSCIKKCPVGFQLTTWNTCRKVDEQREPATISYSSYDGCPINFPCHFPRRFCYRLQCLLDCPDNTKKYGFQCVNKCPQQAPYLFNQTCLESCPASHSFETHRVCSSACPNWLLTHDKLCVDKCPNDTYLYRNSCLTRCPNASSFILKRNNFNSCSERCPVYSFENNHTCELECPKDRPYLLNRSCVQSCPDDFQYYMLKDTQTYSFVICLPFCPEDRVLDMKSCVTRCAADMLLFNRTCVHVCPNGTYQSGSECTSQCPNARQYISKNKCTYACPNGQYVFNTTHCVSQCPISHPLVAERSSECRSKCTIGEYYYKNKCYRACPYNLKTMNSTCVEDCRTTQKPLQNGRYCVSRCSSSKFNNNYTCVFSCPSSKYIFNRTCIESCPKSHPYHFDKYCRANCSGYIKYHYRYECFYTCPNNLSSFESKCIKDCKTTNKPLLHDDGFHKTCVSKCPYAMVINGFICSPQCLSTHIYILNNTCLAECPRSYHYYRKHVNFEKYFECFRFCKDPVTNDGSSCFNICPKGTLKYKKVCVRHCPKTSPWIFETSIDFKCKGDCDNIEVKEITCSANCPSTHKFYLNKTCLTKCPPSHKFYYKKLFEENHECLKNCKYGPANYKTLECLNIWTCSDGMLTLDGLFCVPNCPADAVKTLSYCWTIQTYHKYIFLSGFIITSIGLLMYAYCSTNKRYKNRTNVENMEGTDEEETCLMELYEEDNTSIEMDRENDTQL